MGFTERIDGLLQEKNINKTKFLSDLGYSKNAYSEWKKGITQSYMNKIDKIADYFNVSTDYLLGRTDDPAFTIPEYQYFSEHELTEEEKKKVDEYVELLIKARK